jgi:hypothetical protein
MKCGVSSDARRSAITRATLSAETPIASSRSRVTQSWYLRGTWDAEQSGIQSPSQRNSTRLRAENFRSRRMHSRLILARVRMTLGTRVDYAQLIKVYGAPADDEHRYSPASVVEAIVKPAWGQPDPDKICTSHVERQNLTMRMQIRRLTRLTNAFSKRWDNLRATLALYFGWYNFCRTHRTIRCTAAMEAKVADHIRTIGELLGATQN